MGFRQFLDESCSGIIITSYHFPNESNFHFSDFYNRLSEKGTDYFDFYVIKLIKLNYFHRNIKKFK